jgi:hypothetical protein
MSESCSLERRTIAHLPEGWKQADPLVAADGSPYTYAKGRAEYIEYMAALKREKGEKK